MMVPKKKLLLAAIVFIAFFFRFQNINWDSNLHLHPDERFLTMVSVAMKLPSTFNDYLDPGVSSMNPSNVGYSFYVYGTLPVVLTKCIAILLNADTYHTLTLLGRAITGLLDVGIVLLIFHFARQLEKEKLIGPSIKYWASFIYAVSVLPIQYAHFFTTDTFMNIFLFGSLYFAFVSYRKATVISLILSSVLFGLAIASKINALLMFPLLLSILLLKPLKNRQLLETANVMLIFFLAAYIVIRIASPYYFQSPDFFDVTPNSLFAQNLHALKSFEGRDVQYPPALQWINTLPVVFPVLNMALFGLGLPIFFLSVLGIARAAYFLYKHRKSKGVLPLLIIMVWAAGVFLYQSVQFVKVMRYFLFLYPFIALAAAGGVSWLIQRYKRKFVQLTLIIGIIVLIWPLVFSSIYFVKTTRLVASEWIFQHVPDNSQLASEYWDDALPVSAEYPPPRSYRAIQLPVFDPDSASKWHKIEKELQAADYYILSSNRGWGTLPSIPERFPQATQFYRDLFDGKKGYSLVKSFYPVYYPCSILSLTCPRILSNIFDESFTVYDHPTVYIFKNNEKFP